MKIRVLVALSVIVFLVALAVPHAVAQGPTPPPKPKGVAVKGLVSSLGGFSATVNTPILVSGATVLLEPGGQTGWQQFRVPTYVYILEGILTTDYEAGPVGIQGIQYHAAGQSFMDNGSWWHNHTNRTDKPLRYLMLHIGYPGAATVQKSPDE